MQISNIKKLHYFSGIVISIFVGLHLLNHFYSLWGVNNHIELMGYLRVVYRNVVVETILLFAVGIQIISGIKLFLKARKSTLGGFERLQIWTGLYLAFFLVIHVSSILSGRILMNLDTNFYFGVAGLNTFPLTLFFVPYYGLAIISFFGHIASVHNKKMKSVFWGIKPINQSYIILIIGVISTLIIFYGLTNGFNGIEIPEEYQY